eukprot:TRINITY_DN13029_c0_g1_i1.p1 TRINITY_DN13029_c0_g1~~TRINITY_DN13029_c0_g1_i1.p1  ORF type:complete len:234 (-),score=51.74 TRINITY_DN13029_c0_g1_i1:41-742(-)
MMLHKVGVFFLLGLLCAQATYVVMSDGQTKCFRSEVPQDTLIVGTFKSEALVNEASLGNSAREYNPGGLSVEEGRRVFEASQWNIMVTVKNPFEEVVLERQYEPTSRFALTSSSGGEYQVCFRSVGASPFSGLKWKMEVLFHTGVEAQNYDDVAQNEHLSKMEVSLRKLYDRALEIRQELDYQKSREIAFRDISESTNTRAVLWSVFQICIVVGSALWQMRYLKSFFRKRKLI